MEEKHPYKEIHILLRCSHLCQDYVKNVNILCRNQITFHYVDQYNQIFKQVRRRTYGSLVKVNELI